MSKAAASQEDWSGKTFANGWVIQKKIPCKEYRVIYKQATGEDKIIKNTHYLCKNNQCGIITYIERTVIDRALKNHTSCLSKCKGCNCDRTQCHYSVQVREKNLTKTPDRTPKVKEGVAYGLFKVIKLYPSGSFSDHQMKVDVQCQLCGAMHFQCRVDSLLEHIIACDCFRQRSSGELRTQRVLEKYGIPFKTEVIFQDLVGLKGGSLRYDFGLLDNNNKVVALIEFDGEQHYQESGSYFNADGHVQLHDEIKNDFALNEGFPLLRIPYWVKDNELEQSILTFLKENNYD